MVAGPQAARIGLSRRRASTVSPGRQLPAAILSGFKPVAGFLVRTQARRERSGSEPGRSPRAAESSPSSAGPRPQRHRARSSGARRRPPFSDDIEPLHATRPAETCLTPAGPPAARQVPCRRGPADEGRLRSPRRDRDTARTVMGRRPVGRSLLTGAKPEYRSDRTTSRHGASGSALAALAPAPGSARPA